MRHQKNDRGYFCTLPEAVPLHCNMRANVNQIQVIYIRYYFYSEYKKQKSQTELFVNGRYTVSITDVTQKGKVVEPMLTCYTENLHTCAILKIII